MTAWLSYRSKKVETGRWHTFWFCFVFMLKYLILDGLKRLLPCLLVQNILVVVAVLSHAALKVQRLHPTSD